MIFTLKKLFDVNQRFKAYYKPTLLMDTSFKIFTSHNLLRDEIRLFLINATLPQQFCDYLRIKVW